MVFSRRKKENEVAEEPGLLQQTTLRGGFRSAFRVGQDGAKVLHGGIDELRRRTADTLSQKRVESFSMAMERLGVEERMLPVIHNQVVAQCYMTWFVALVAVTMAVNLGLRGSLVSGLASLCIGLACLAAGAQASVRALAIRRRSLDVGRLWLSSPSVWLPDRIDEVVPRGAADMRMSGSAAAVQAARARKLIVTGALLLVCGVLLAALGALFPMRGWSALFIVVGLFVLLMGLRTSFELFQQRHNCYCDLYHWIRHLGEILPSKQPSDPRKGPTSGQ